MFVPAERERESTMDYQRILPVAGSFSRPARTWRNCVCHCCSERCRVFACDVSSCAPQMPFGFHIVAVREKKVLAHQGCVVSSMVAVGWRVCVRACVRVCMPSSRSLMVLSTPPHTTDATTQHSNTECGCHRCHRCHRCRWCHRIRNTPAVISRRLAPVCTAAGHGTP